MVRNPQSIQEKIEAATLLCARQGTQLTARRKEILEFILEAEAPVTAYQLLDRLRRNHKGAVPPMVYRALDFLIENELIHKIESMSAFVPCIEAGHHSDAAQFLICRHCGSVTEMKDDAVSKALDDAASQRGFHPDNIIVEIRGACGTCSHPA